MKPNQTMEQLCSSFLAEQATKNQRRKLRPICLKNHQWLERSQKKLLNFSSNDYLGLSQHPLLIQRASEWAETWGVGATASRLVSGDFEIHQQIEAKVAALKGSESALIFNSGFQANVALLGSLLDSTFLGQTPLVFADRLVHASIHQGLKVAGVKQIRFRHNDLNHLEMLLRKHQNSSAPRFIITESVFSMDGDCVEMEGLALLAERFGAMLYVDEAHATGVLGPKGAGLTAGHPVDLVMGTFSKALGSAGAFLACSHKVRDYLIQRCAGFIYSTAPPPPVLGAMDAALDLLPHLDEERAYLENLALTLRHSFQEMGLNIGSSQSQIVPLILGDEGHTLQLAEALESVGILGVAIRPPTVQAGKSRIRFALSSQHSQDDLTQLISSIQKHAHI